MNKNTAIKLTIVLAWALVPLTFSVAMEFKADPTSVSRLNVVKAIEIIISMARLVFAGFAVAIISVSSYLFITGQESPQRLNFAKAAAFWGFVGFSIGIFAFIVLFATRNAITGLLV